MAGARALCAAVLVAAAACGARGAGPAAARPTVRLRLDALDGGEIDTAAYRGRVVVLHLFTTDSTASVLDYDQLAALHQREPRRAVVIGIVVDPVGYAIASAWRRGTGAGYLLAMADDGLRRGAGPLGLIKTVPTTVILDRAGRALHRIERPLDRGELARLVAPLLGAPR
jgi:peroxiredoxin